MDDNVQVSQLLKAAAEVRCFCYLKFAFTVINRLSYFHLFHLSYQIKLFLKTGSSSKGKVSKSFECSRELPHANMASIANEFDSRLNIQDVSSPRKPFKVDSGSPVSLSRCSACRVKKLAESPAEIVHTLVDADARSTVEHESVFVQTDSIDVNVAENESVWLVQSERANMEAEDISQHLLSIIQDQSTQLSELAARLRDSMALLQAEREMRLSSAEDGGRRREAEEVTMKEKGEHAEEEALRKERDEYLKYKKRVSQEMSKDREEIGRLGEQLEALRLSLRRAELELQQQKAQHERFRSDSEEELQMLRGQSQRDQEALADLRRERLALSAAADAAQLREREGQAERSELLALGRRRDEQLRALTYEVSCLQRRLACRDGHSEGHSDPRVAELEQILAECKVREYHYQLEISNLKLQLVGKSHSMFS